MSGFSHTLFAGERFAIVGLGRNGLPAARALAAMGAEVTLWDDHPPARDAAAAEGFTIGERATGIDALVLSPGIPHRLPAPHRLAQAALEAGVPIVSDAELLFRAVRRAGSAARFAGITGTNGKSTTTALLAHVLAAAGAPVAAGGNLGPAALSLPYLGDDGVYVLEMSSYMLERIVTLRFDAAAMLNLSTDHLDRHGDMAGYAAVKQSVFDRQQAGDTAVIGIDDAWSRGIAEFLARRVTISGQGAADIACVDGVLCDSVGPVLDMRDAPALPGAHNAQNAAAVCAMALALGVSRADVARGISSFAGLAHRQQRVATVRGVAYVNDSKATNADAAARALACYDRVIWIAGGIAKSDGIVPLAPLFPRIAHALLIGRDAPRLAATLAEHGVPHSILGTLDQAMAQAQAMAEALGAHTVLLSPACASFDQFSGFDARGEKFAALAAGAA